MKKLSVLITVVLAVFLIAGCAHYTTGSYGSSSGAGKSSASRNNEQSSKTSSSTADQKTQAGSGTASVNQGSFEQTQQEIRAALKTAANVKLPQLVPVSGGYDISAQAQGTSSGYTVTYKQTARPVKVNDPSLSQAETLVTLKAVTYSNDAEAGGQITFHQYGASDGQPVDLGHRITGYEAAGAGTAGVSWNEGRWTLMALSPTSDQEKGISLAKNIVAYLDTYLLPVPHQYGLIQVYTDNRKSQVMWQDGRTVYQLTDVTDPMSLVQIAVSVK
ncbi:hypothetical protein [Sporolactobacillus putidus]|uniref:Lipoprotein n=1 Tax=Sporolactobacillus putidus TaxID=492735 RepID=A0A917S247_9BACL|nr:hypothetical protein [Sporolactobacillus putidus]GGL49814.1 hypothetical protein GCM10007968_12480 [Sporolactobacillus putidus]